MLFASFVPAQVYEKCNHSARAWWPSPRDMLAVAVIGCAYTVTIFVARDDTNLGAAIVGGIANTVMAAPPRHPGGGPHRPLNFRRLLPRA